MRLLIHRAAMKLGAVMTKAVAPLVSRAVVESTELSARLNAPRFTTHFW
jgi:hypothetical protein